MFSFLRPAAALPELPPERIDPEYRRLRWQVFTGIFIGYAAFYLVRKNFALAIPDILKEHPEYTKAALGSAMTGLSVAYGVSKFIMGSVSDRSNPRWFMTLGLLLTAGVTFAFGTIPAIYGSLTADPQRVVQRDGLAPVRQDDGALVEPEGARGGRLALERVP
jgi:OPA family glycerol-3-phosphate transporter-like MFS transporter